jgi:hypothetical protein
MTFIIRMAPKSFFFKSICNSIFQESQQEQEWQQASAKEDQGASNQQQVQKQVRLKQSTNFKMGT